MSTSFYVSLSADQMAWQTAELLNQYNNLNRKHTLFTIKGESADYFTEVYGDRVVGCAALKQEEPTLSVIFHICVAEDYRRRGVAKKLINLAIDNCKTGLIYMTIREDNIPSLTLAKSLGFVFVQKQWKHDHYIYVVGRAKDGYTATAHQQGK